LLYVVERDDGATYRRVLPVFDGPATDASVPIGTDPL